MEGGEGKETWCGDKLDTFKTFQTEKEIWILTFFNF